MAGNASWQIVMDFSSSDGDGEDVPSNDTPLPDEFGTYEADSNFSYEDILYPGDLLKLPLWEFVLKIAFSAVVILASLIGNVLVIVIVWKNRRMRTTTNYYIVNLAVADLLVTCMCSWVHVTHDVTEGWVLGAFFCKVNSFGQVLALVSSILTLTLIACDRFFGIVFAMRAHLTERRATSCIVAVWVCATAVAAPLLVYRTQHTRQWLDHVEIWCDDDWPVVFEYSALNNLPRAVHRSRTVYYTVICVVLFFVPIVVMTTAYSFIVWKLWSSDLPGEHVESGKVAQKRVKKKVALMLIALLLIFVLCWLPLQASVLYAEYRQHKHLMLPEWYPMFQYTATFVAYSNSALNPIVYAGFNDNFKKGFRNLFHIPVPDRRYSSMATSTTYVRRDSFHTTMITKI